MERNKYVFRLAGISLTFPFIPLFICLLFGKSGSDENLFLILFFACLFGLMSVPMAFFQIFLLNSDIALSRAKKLIVIPLGWSLVITAICILASIPSQFFNLNILGVSSIVLWLAYLTAVIALLKFFTRKICI